MAELTWPATVPARVTALLATLLATLPRFPVIDGGNETRTAAMTPRTSPRESTRPHRIPRPVVRSARGALSFGILIGLAADSGVSLSFGAVTFGRLGCFGSCAGFGCVGW